MKRAVLLMLLLLCLPIGASAGQARPQGSTYLLEGRTLLISIYWQDEAFPWPSQGKEHMRDAVEIAAQYLMEQAAACGKQSELLYDAEDLRYEIAYDGANEDSARDDDSFFYTALQLIHEVVPLDDLLQAYGADSYGFLCLLSGAGGSYALPYYADMDAEDEELCVIYLLDPDFPDAYESVPVYAHEILHLFGAIDLYDRFPEDGVTQEVVDYIAQEHPTELMYDTYEPDGSTSDTAVSQELCDITLYMVGLIDPPAILSDFPTLLRTEAGAFYEKETVQQEDVSDDGFDLWSDLAG